MKTLTLTDEQFNTIKNMVDFDTWHAADGMSPALNADELLDNIAGDDNFDENWNRLYDKQKKLIMDVRPLLGLDAEGDYANTINGNIRP